MRWCLAQEAQPVVTALRNQAERIRVEELNKTLRKLTGKLDSQELASLEAMTRAIVNKLLHGPTVFLKEQRASNNLQIAREMFRLSDDGNGEDEESSHLCK